MHSVGIIAEYNPFHNGHAYHIAQAKRLHGGTAVIVLSGDFVQRGETALFDKYSRTRFALENGADMVLQLPTVFSLSSAQRFAHGAVNILSSSGIVDALCFGSECGNIEKLEQAELLLSGDAYESRLRDKLRAGVSYPHAAAHAAETALVLGANDVLAIEYLRAIRDFGNTLSPLCVERRGTEHDGEIPGDAFASAAYIRNTILQDSRQNLASFVPKSVYQSLSLLKARKTEALSCAVLYALRKMTREQFVLLPDVREGLENVLYKQARACTDYQTFLFACKTKRYTLARLKRISMNALLGIRESDLSCPPYIRVLGVRKDAQDLLSQLCQYSTLPVVIDHGDLDKLSPQARRLAEIDLFAADIACMAENAAAVYDYRRRLILV